MAARTSASSTPNGKNLPAACDCACNRPKPSRAAFWAKVALVLAVLSAAFRFADGIKERWYIFEHRSMHELTQEAVARYPNDMPAMVKHITSALAAEHPSWTINTDFENPANWVFNNAGGAMGSMFIIHASITEYLIVFGTALGTEGHSGRHTADDYFNIIQGEQWAYLPGALEKEVYPAGSVHHMKRGEAKQYKFHEGGWAIELAQGWIPPMLPFGFADGLSSTLDVPTLYHTVRLTAESMIRNLLHGKI